MVKRCFVPGCATGNALNVKQQKASGLKYKSLFKPPKNTELFAKWVKALPRKDKVLSESCYVCELHFNEDDVLLYDEAILLDGTVHKLKRIRPILRTGAVPCLLPNQPLNLTKHNNKSKPPTERSSYIDENKSKQIPAFSDTRWSQNIIQELFSFQYLKENIDQLEKPDSKWMVELKDDEVELVRWDCGSSKRIIISNVLTIEIYFCGNQMMDHIIGTTLLSMDETNKLLKYIHSLKECKGIMIAENNITRRSNTCKGYVEKRLGQRGPKGNYCFDCRVGRKRMADSLRKKVLKLENEIQNK